MLHPARDMKLVPLAVEVFGRSATMRVVSLPDPYGGKICAALDRQQPRDLFDVHELLQNVGRRKICSGKNWDCRVSVKNIDRSQRLLLQAARGSGPSIIEIMHAVALFR